MKIKFLGGKLIVVITLILVFVDVFTALSAGDLFKFAEANPLFLWSGSIWLVLVVNLVWVACLYWCYCKFDSTSRFLLCNIFVWLTLLRVLAIKSNLAARAVFQQAVDAGPQAVEELLVRASSVSSQVKVDHYVGFVVPYLLPLFLTFVVFLVFKIDHKVFCRYQKEKLE